MIVVAVNEANKKIDEETEKKMSKFGNIPGLFQEMLCILIVLKI